MRGVQQGTATRLGHGRAEKRGEEGDVEGEEEDGEEEGAVPGDKGDAEEAGSLQEDISEPEGLSQVLQAFNLKR